jgi:1-deoxy-D-xylulose-5-phosphate reductoisomerase
MRGVAVLGSTGSIGTSTLRVLERHRDQFRVVALTAYGSADLLRRQARAANAPFVGLVNGGNGVRGRSGPEPIATGAECLVAAATHPDVDIVVNAIVGAAGIRATLAALEAGKRVALANKETLVVAGELVLAAARTGRGEIVPVDSEHSAVLQCVAGRPDTEIRRLVLTASGGPFREWPAERLPAATVEQALRHPTWAMGRKITVDSATLANKALEVIEGHFLFGLGYDAIEVVVHPQSVVHAFVGFVDGSVLAQVGFPNMELPILYALTHPERLPDSALRPFDAVAASPLTFEPVRVDVFRAFAIGVQAGARGGTAPAVYNAANEVAVRAFLDRRIGFHRIGEVIEQVLERHEVRPADDLESILEADRWARAAGDALCS